jgi:hypothetical protein
LLPERRYGTLLIIKREREKERKRKREREKERKRERERERERMIDLKMCLKVATFL